MRIPWDTGVSQATEAVALPVKERLAKFSFTYEGSQPRFNSCMLQELQCKQLSHEEFPDAASLTPPDSTQSSPITVQTLSNHFTPPPPSNSSTPTGKMPSATKAPKAPVSRQYSHKEQNALFRKRKKVVPVVVLPLIDAVVQVSAVISLINPNLLSIFFPSAATNGTFFFQDMSFAADEPEPNKMKINKSGLFTKESSLKQVLHNCFFFILLLPLFQSVQI